MFIVAQVMPSWEWLNIIARSELSSDLDCSVINSRFELDSDLDCYELILQCFYVHVLGNMYWEKSFAKHLLIERTKIELLELHYVAVVRGRSKSSK